MTYKKFILRYVQEKLSGTSSVRWSHTEGIPFDYNSYFQEKIAFRKRNSIYRVFKKVNRDATCFPEADEFSFNKKRILVWCSNDVLGMSRHPAVINAVYEAAEKYGVGSGGARGLSGNSLLHEQLEQELADLHRKESAFVSTSGFLSNSSCVAILAKSIPGCQIYSASANHASLVEGILNSRAPKHIFENGNVAQLEDLLSQSEINLPKLVIFESVASMTGMKSPVDALCRVAHRYGALTFVDEVHAIGLYGHTGGGIGEALNTTDKMDIIAGSLGKAIGNIGAYITGSRVLIDTVRSYAPGFIFTTALPAMTLAGSLTALRILKSPEGVELRQKHQANVDFLKTLLVDAGLPVELNDSHIIPVMVGDPALCTKLGEELINEKGHYVPGVNYPTVPKGQEKLRITPTPFHTMEMMASLVTDIVEVWKRLVISQKFDKQKSIV